jgi:hypothetical protein
MERAAIALSPPGHDAKLPTLVIPAKAGISLPLRRKKKLKRDSSFRWNDG